MLIRTWLGIGGFDANGLLTALQGLNQAASTSPWSDLVLLVEEPAASELLTQLPAVLGHPVPAGWPASLTAGFHPLHVGTLHVLVCVGPVQANLGELVCQAHAVWVSSQVLLPECAEGPPQTIFSRLARCCAQHASLSTSPAPVSNGHTNGLQTAGFKPGDSNLTDWVYQPPWPVRPLPSPPAQARHAVVVGAGLAGAATTWALVRRGWRVHLLDAQPAPAMGASGLPVGVMTEHQAGSDTVLSALSRVGVPLHWRELNERVPPGQGWEATTVANLKDIPADQLPPLEHLLADPTHASKRQSGALVRPAALVKAWLSAARQTGLLTETWGQNAEAIQPVPPMPGSETGWRVQMAGAQVVHAPHVVLASAYGTQALLAPHSHPAALPLRPVKGQLTYGALGSEPWAPCPIRHQGVWVPAYTDSGLSSPTIWAMGSTYERGQNHTECTSSSQDANMQSLHTLSPSAHCAIASQPMNNWAGVRCASLDRLPLAGPLPAVGHAWNASDRLEQIPREPGLWTLCALGSRGLTLSGLLGEWVAAQMSGAPWPLEKSLAQALDPARFALRHARKLG